MLMSRLEDRCPSDRKANILVVDDHAPNLQALEAILGDFGNIVRAASGGEALAWLLEREFAVVILDVRMPGMDGFETAKRIRRQPRSESLPIVFVTAGDDSLELVTHGYSVGAVDFIRKPIHADILRSKVRVFVDLFEKSRALEQSRNFYLKLLDDFPTLIWKSGKEGRSDYFNRSWLSFVGRPLSEEVKDGWPRGIHPEDRKRCTEAFREAFQARRAFESEYRLRRHDGVYRWILDCGRPYVDVQGGFAGYLSSCHDITRRRESEEEMQASNRELEAFSYTVSHDLRAPLRTLEGFSQALLSDYSGRPLDEQGLDYAGRIARAARQMDDLIGDLLAFSRLAREDVEIGSIDLGPLVAEVLAQTNLRKGVVHVLGTLPCVLGNGRLLYQVFSNLLSNAVKFVLPGAMPQVRIRAERAGEAIRIWIEDNGIGIPPEYHERVFRVFERLHSHAAYPGTGIGLAIVRRAMQRLKGRAGVESTPDQGSGFWIELPEVPDCASSPLFRREEPGQVRAGTSLVQGEEPEGSIVG